MKVFRIYTRALGILWKDERNLTAALSLTCIFVAFVSIKEAILFGNVVDALSKGSGVIYILGLWATLGMINIGASVFLAVMSDRLAHRERLNTLDQVFERVIALPVSYHSEQGSGRVVHAIHSGIEQLFQLWLSFMREHLASIIIIGTLVPVALKKDWRMAIVLFCLAAIYTFANFYIVKKTHARQETVESYHQNLFARIGDVISNVNVVQSYTRLWDEIEGLQGISAQLLNAQYPILTWWGVLSVITGISRTLTMVIILATGAYLVSHGKISVGEVVAFVGFANLLIGKVEQISSFFPRIMARAPALQHFFSLLDQEGAAIELPNARPIVNVRGTVAFNHVSYIYKDGRNGVFDLDFRAEAGQTVALVGPSGAGKTTTLALMQRLFDPSQGTITIDDEDIRNFTLSSLRSCIGTVFQDAGLFNRSISENIRVGRPTATNDEVIEAARQADAHDFIMNKPGDYNFIIGERGTALSGGERQRIAIARAILKNAPILIFDEATSALDNQTEKKIQAAIANLRAQQKTSFVIAHRLSTVVTADHILVFERGRVIEAGTFESLREKNGLFANLVKLGEIAPAKTPGAST